MKEYEDKLVELNERETFQSYMTIEEDQKVNYNTDIMLARNKGIEEGKLEGIEESQKNSIISLYNKKYNAEQISNLLDYDLDFVEKVIKEKLN